MTDTPKKLKLYPSAAGFAQGRAVTAKYNSACLRYMVVAKHAPKPPFNPLFGKVGAIHEDLHAEKLGDDLLHRELPFKKDITPNVELSGRLDFQLKDGSIDETKGSYSKNMLKKVIEKGEYELGHLAQLVSYLIQFQQTRGRIVVGYYEEAEDGALVQQGYRELVVTIEDDGTIAVDGAPTPFKAQDQWAHTLLAAEALETEIIAPRPVNAEGWSSPCSFCPMRNTCDDYDFGALTEEQFIAAGIEDIKNAKPMEAKINKVKEPKRGRKRASKDLDAD